MSDASHTDISCKVIGCQTCAIRAQNSNWIPGTCVKCGGEFLFWKDATGKRCNDCERQGIVHPEPTASIEYKNLFSAYLEALAQAEKLAAALSESKTMLSKIKNHPFCLRCDSNIETKHRANAITSKALAEFKKWKDEK